MVWEESLFEDYLQNHKNKIIVRRWSDGVDVNRSVTFLMQLSAS